MSSKFRKHLKTWKKKKSTGEDEISKEMLKCCSSIREPHITKLLNNCVKEGILPNCFKIAKVLPIFKKGDRKGPGKYKPIRLLSS